MHKKAFDGIFVHETRLQTHYKWDYTHFCSLSCYVRKEKLGRGNFLCKTWKIFYDSLNFLRISFPNYIYIIFWLRGITQKKRNMKLKQMWTLNSLFSRVSRKLSRPTSLWKKKTISHIHYWMHFLVSIS